jgi:isoleucyl-tRNA synthetase
MDSYIGADLVGSSYMEPMREDVCPILTGDHVTAVSGTGK